jgi:large subunit ribosomal protein L13
MSAKKWHVVDAEGLRLGRMASEVAKLLLGKHKPSFTPGADVGDVVVIVNAEKVGIGILSCGTGCSTF